MIVLEYVRNAEGNSKVAMIAVGKISSLAIQKKNDRLKAVIESKTNPFK